MLTSHLVLSGTKAVTGGPLVITRSVMRGDLPEEPLRCVRQRVKCDSCRQWQKATPPRPLSMCAIFLLLLPPLRFVSLPPHSSSVRGAFLSSASPPARIKLIIHLRVRGQVALTPLYNCTPLPHMESGRVEWQFNANESRTRVQMFRCDRVQTASNLNERSQKRGMLRSQKGMLRGKLAWGQRMVSRSADWLRQQNGTQFEWFQVLLTSERKKTLSLGHLQGNLLPWLRWWNSLGEDCEAKCS